MDEINVKGKRYRVASALASSNPNVVSKMAVVPDSHRSSIPSRGMATVAGVGQRGNDQNSNEGVHISTDYYRNDIIGKPYPGRVNFRTQRTLALYSPVIRAILNTRSHQVAKLPIKIVPRDEQEPPKQMNILDYSVYDLEHIPAFDENEAVFLKRIYERLDPQLYLAEKRHLMTEKQDEFSESELATIRYLQDKHDEFYAKRKRDIKKILKILNNPDPYFTQTDSWESLIKKILWDGLIIDRGVILKIRDENTDELEGLMPVDGACYSDDTEVLTRRGWKLFSDVTVDDEFATRDRDGYFQWQGATDFQKVEWQGEMYNFLGEGIDLLVSPNHRMLLTDGEKETFVTAEEAANMKDTHYIPVTSTWEGAEEERYVIEGEDEYYEFSSQQYLALLGTYLQRGHFTINGTVSIEPLDNDQLNAYTYMQLINTLGSNVISVTEKGYIHIRSDLINSRLAEMEYGIPDFVRDCTPADINHFLYHYFMGDDNPVLEKEEAGVVQELIQKTGYAALVDEAIGGGYVVYIEEKSTLAEFKVDKVDYNGYIYCVSVPNTTLYVRRGGKAAWCGNSIRPIVNEYGLIDEEYAYIQVVYGSPNIYLKQKDVSILSMQPVTDLTFFGYGLPLMETLYTTVLSDIFIDKGNLDYYRKGGSIPEGFISIEPPTSKDGAIGQLDQQQLEAIQRHMESIMMGDFTQLPIVSGGKVSYIDFKGKRKDMQFRELADYIARKTCAVWQVSPQDVGILSDVNRSTSQTQAEMTRSKGLETLMMSISTFFTNNVIREVRPEDDLKLWFHDDDMARQKEEWTIPQQKLVSGAQSINEYRASQGEHPVPWGNTPLQGLRNWKPEDPAGEMGGGLPGLPPMPGAGAPPPGLPGMMNPGGPIGGANPMSGQGPANPAPTAPIGSPSAMKSRRFFDIEPTTEDDVDELAVKSVTDLYLQEAKFSNFIDIKDILSYPGAESYRDPIDAYEHFIHEHNLGVQLHKSTAIDDDDVLLFSHYEGNGVVSLTEDGEAPLMKALTKRVLEISEPDVLKSVRSTVQEWQVEDAVELAILESLDEPLRDKLNEDFYQFQTPTVSPSQVEQVREILKLGR